MEVFVSIRAHQELLGGHWAYIGPIVLFGLQAPLGRLLWNIGLVGSGFCQSRRVGSNCESAAELPSNVSY